MSTQYMFLRSYVDLKKEDFLYPSLSVTKWSRLFKGKTVRCACSYLVLMTTLAYDDHQLHIHSLPQ